MTTHTKNLLILLIILLGGLVFVFAAEYFFEVTPDNLGACTEEAKICPDGSVVVRGGSNCEFTPCPEESDSDAPIDSSSSSSGSVSNETPTTPPKIDESVVCTMDAKQCPDGSYVGRMAPNCEFAACPTDVPVADRFMCSPESRNVDACIEVYQPVCGLMEVQCITEPCEPVLQTFSNGCFACQSDNVIFYTEGACEDSI